MSALRSALLWGFRRVIAIYFREIEVMGHAPPRATGGRIFAANHVNGLVDPVLVLTSADCPICPVAKSTLWRIPGLRWLLDAVDAVPIVRRRDEPGKPAGANDEAFERVAKHLSGGGNILIFPEGTSHNEPQLGTLKSGAGRMLAGARAGGARGLTFQAVGLEFDARDVFRSRALVLYGPVRDVDALARDAGAGAEEATDAAGPLARAITDQLREDLSELIVEGSTWDERVLVARVAEVFANDAGDGTLAAWNAVGRQVEAATRVLRATSKAAYDDVASRVSRYYALLAAAGETDERVARGRSASRAPGGIARPLRVALLPLSLAGVVLYALPYQVPRLVARLAGHEVDVISTYKLGAGLVVFSVWAAALVVAGALLLPAPLALIGALVALGSPFAALDLLDRSTRRARGPRSEATLAGLASVRAELRAVLDRTRSGLTAGDVPDSPGSPIAPLAPPMV